MADFRFRKIAQPWYEAGFVVLPATVDKHPDVLRFRQYCEWSNKTDEEGVTWKREYASAKLLNHFSLTKPHSNGLVLLDSNPAMPRLVVDVDDMAQLPWVIEQFGDTPLKVTTGRDGGGIQLVYACEPGIKYEGWNGRIGPPAAWFQRETDGIPNGNWNTHIDIKSAAGYVIAPGSIHQSGLEYKASQPITRELLLSLPVLDWQKLKNLEWKDCPRDHGKPYVGSVVATEACGVRELDIMVAKKRYNKTTCGYEVVDFATISFPGWSSLLAFAEAKQAGEGRRKIGSPFHGSDSGERGGSGHLIRKGSKLKVKDYYDGRTYYHRSGYITVSTSPVSRFETNLGSQPNVLDTHYGGSLNRETEQVDTDESGKYEADLATQTKHLVYDILNPPRTIGCYNPASGSILEDLDTTILEPQVDQEWDKIGNQTAFCARGRTCSSVKRKPTGVVMVNSKTPCNAYQCPSCGLLQRSCLQAGGGVAMRPLRDANWVGLQYTEHVSRKDSPTRKHLEYWVAGDPANRQYLSVMQTPDNEGRRWVGKGIPHEIVPATPTTIQYLCLYATGTDSPNVTGAVVSSENLEAVAAGFFAAIDPAKWEGHGRACVLGGSRNLKHLIATLRDGAYGRNKKKNQNKTSTYERQPMLHSTSMEVLREEVTARTPFTVAVVHSKKDTHEVGFRRTMTESLQIVAPNPMVQAVIEDMGESLIARLFDRMLYDGVFVDFKSDLSAVEWIPGSCR